MNTLVYQSYRTAAVPSWISRCLGTVRSWASGRGYEYRFIDDRLLDYVPAWYREKVRGRILPISDLARLEVAKELFAEGFERTIWVDADMLVFDATRFDVEIPGDVAFCREVWTTAAPGSRVRCFRKVNNSVSLFARNPAFLGRYIDHCLRSVREAKEVGDHAVGTRWLTRLHRENPFSLLENVGMASPALMKELSSGGNSALKACMKAVNRPLAAANLCGSMNEDGKNDALYETVVDELLRSRGDAINRHLP